MMEEQANAKRERLISNREEEDYHNNHNQLIECASQILPWLNPKELSNISLTCKTLYYLSKSITVIRSLDASRSFETHPIPFINPHHDYQYPYTHFIYAPTQVPSSPSPPRQRWGSTKLGTNSLSQLVRVSAGGGIGHRRSVSHVGGLGQKEGGQWSESGCAGNTKLARIECYSLSGSDCDLVSEVSGLREDETTCCGCDCEGCEFGMNRLLGLEELEMGIMIECGPSCGGGLECGNRLTQRGIEAKLKIVRDRRKGWGLFADQLIRRGQFVCEYAGELLTTEEARQRQKVYDELSASGRFSSALLVVREHLPSGKACLRVNIDATRIGNAARFINHSCDGGNLSTILVRSSGSLLPRLCFFASKDIKEGEELTFSYGEIRVRSNGIQCFCGSSSCFGTLPAEDI